MCPGTGRHRIAGQVSNQAAAQGDGMVPPAATGQEPPGE